MKLWSGVQTALDQAFDIFLLGIPISLYVQGQKDWPPNLTNIWRTQETSHLGPEIMDVWTTPALSWVSLWVLIWYF